ncbi:MAG TPA: Gfo/Idh/MocA family oxidoreductase [Candidatus Omnitrophica bacterium]|nr:Gfo/Idh/MocA family oxidoreductase [Candidatus Omnitrophota bacterium]
MKERLGFAVIGCGVISSWHADAIRAIDEAELRAVCDVAEEKARQMGEKYGVDWYTDYNELFRRPDIHVVNICVPSGLRSEVVVPAAQAGKHIIAEKPLEVTLEKADKITRTARENRVKLAVIFQSRFSDDATLLRKALQEGRFGRLVYGEASLKWYRTQAYYDSGDWRGTWKLDGGGALMNQAIHAVDFLQWMMGEVDSLFAYTGLLAHERIEVEDTAVASLKFKNGALGSIIAMTSAYPGYAKRIEIYGTDGASVLEDDHITVWNFKEEREEDKRIKEEILKREVAKSEAMGASSPTAGLSYEPHRRQIVDMIRAIREDTEPLVNGEEGRKSMEIILGIYESSKTGKPVKLPL